MILSSSSIRSFWFTTKFSQEAHQEDNQASQSQNDAKGKDRSQLPDTSKPLLKQIHPYPGGSQDES